MHPILIDLGTVDLPFFGEVTLQLPTYGAAFALAAALAWIWFDRRARTIGIGSDARFNLLFYSLLAGVVGAKLLLVIVDLPRFLENPKDLAGVVRAGGVLLGGVLLGATTFFVYAWRSGMPMLRLLDALAGPLILAQGIGRLGCFGAGCCWGSGVDAAHPLAVTYTHAAAHETTGVPLHTPLLPVQLFELGIDLLLLVPLMLLWRAQPRPGTVWWWYVALYGTARFVLEFFRGDLQRGVWLGGALSTSQILSAAGVTLAAVLLLRGRRR